jgi:uncharacterized SAM-binding protein YcdF (DUF218 family)
VTSPGRGRSGAAIVVLGCRVERDGRPSSALGRRIHWASVAFAAGLGDVVIASGGRAWGSHVEGTCIARELEAAGVPSASVYPELCSLTTAENALFSSRIARDLGLEAVLVTTCSWHVRRAVVCFERVGLVARPLGAEPPPAGGLVKLRRTVHEVVSLRLDAWHLRRMLASEDALSPFDHAAGSRLG